MVIEVVKLQRADPGRVWKALCDVEGWPALVPTVDSVSRTAGVQGTLAKGDRFLLARPGLRAAEYVVTSHLPGRSFTWEARLPGLRAVATHAVSAGIRGGCTVRLTMRWTGTLSVLANLRYARFVRDCMHQEAAAALAAGAVR